MTLSRFTFPAFRRFRLIRCVLTRLGCCLSDEVDPRRRFYTDPPTTTFTQCTYTTHARTHRTEGDQETALSSVDESKDLCDLVLSTAPSQNLLSTQTCIRWQPTIELRTSILCLEIWRKYGWSHRVENTTIPKKNLFVKKYTKNDCGKLFWVIQDYHYIFHKYLISSFYSKQQMFCFLHNRILYRLL